MSGLTNDAYENGIKIGREKAYKEISEYRKAYYQELQTIAEKYHKEMKEDIAKLLESIEKI